MNRGSISAKVVKQLIENHIRTLKLVSRGIETEYSRGQVDALEMLWKQIDALEKLQNHEGGSNETQGK